MEFENITIDREVIPQCSLNIENNNHMLQGGNIYNYYRYGETPTTAGYWWTIDTNGDIVKTIIE